MATNRITGKNGETLACRYLQQLGFTILHRNWRYSYFEIDLIASRDGVLHFVEVKTRTSHRFGSPEEAVSPRKMKKIFQAAEAFLEQNPGWKQVQYDVLAITLANQYAEYFFIEDVYYW